MIYKTLCVCLSQLYNHLFCISHLFAMQQKQSWKSFNKNGTLQHSWSIYDNMLYVLEFISFTYMYLKW